MFAMVSQGKSKKKTDVAARQKEGYSYGKGYKQGSSAMKAFIPKVMGT